MQFSNAIEESNDEDDENDECNEGPVGPGLKHTSLGRKDLPPKNNVG